MSCTWSAEVAPNASSRPHASRPLRPDGLLDDTRRRPASRFRAPRAHSEREGPTPPRTHCGGGVGAEPARLSQRSAGGSERPGAKCREVSAPPTPKGRPGSDPGPFRLFDCRPLPRYPGSLTGLAGPPVAWLSARFELTMRGPRLWTAPQTLLRTRGAAYPGNAMRGSARSASPGTPPCGLLLQDPMGPCSYFGPWGRFLSSPCGASQ